MSACKRLSPKPLKRRREVQKGSWSSPIEGRPIVDAGGLDGRGIDRVDVGHDN